MDGFLAYLVALIVLIVCSAFFSGSEAALFSLNRVQVSHLRKQPGADGEIAALLATPRRVLITILIGNLVVNVFSTSAATSIAVSLYGNKGLGLAFAVMSVIILIFGEIFPKVLAINAPQTFARAAAYPLKFLNTLFYPAGVPITYLTDRVIEILKRQLGAARRSFSKDELLTAFDIGRDEGYVGKFEYDLLSNIIEFRDTVVKETMTPSIGVFSLPIDMSPDEMVDKLLSSDLSRAPVCGETADDIKGIVHIKDLAATTEGPDFDIESILRVPYYVPESMKISQLFNDLAGRRTHLAVVIDEYGSYVGIVTMEDILEELVGEIRDSNEPQTVEYTRLDERRIVVLGTMEIDRFNEVFEENIVDDDNETIAGYVTGITGSIPKAGATIEIDALRFHIISAEPNRIRKMRVEKI